MSVTVIVLNFNGLANNYLPACLDSLRCQSYPAIQLVVVDNASDDESCAYVGRSKDTLLVPSPQPVGFGQANNLGYAHANGDFVLFANNDTVFSPDCVQQLVDAMDLAPDIGMVAPKLVRPSSSTRAILDSAGTLLRRDLTMYDRGFSVPDQGQFDTTEYVFAPCGAAAFFRRVALEAVRHADGTLWDEDFFYYYEDGDLGWRVRNAGWNCVYYPAARATHHRGAYMPPKFFDKTHRFKVHTIKNRYLMIAKNAPTRRLLVNLPFLMVREVLIWAYLLLHPSLLRDVVRAIGGSLNRAWARRKQTKLGDRGIGLFASHRMPTAEDRQSRASVGMRA